MKMNNSNLVTDRHAVRCQRNIIKNLQVAAPKNLECRFESSGDRYNACVYWEVRLRKGPAESGDIKDR